MASFEEALPILYKAEFNNASNALEWLETENGYTFMGIYQDADPDWSGWNIVLQKMSQYNDIKTVSKILYANEAMQRNVANYYKKKYWDGMRLDEVKSQHIANEMFLFGVVAWITNSIKKAQELIGVKADGIIGTKTLEALNNFDEKVFDIKFDEKEIEYFKAIVKSKPQKERFLNGWINRAYLV